MTKLAQVLSKERTAKNISLRDMQRFSNNTITSTYVHNIETLGMIPSPKKLRVISGILKLNFLELMIIAGHLEKSDLIKRG